MLRTMMERGCTLIDYETMVDQRGRRLVFFGRYAGIAGMVDTLWALGQRLKHLQIDTPFSEVKQTIHYHRFEEIAEHLQTIGAIIQKHGLPKALTPCIVGYAGYGNVAKGAQEILEYLPVRKISPQNIKSLYDHPSNKCLYKVVFKEEHMVQPISQGAPFDLQEYYQHPERYQSIFEHSIPDLTVLMNCIYWDTQYPRLVTKEFVKQHNRSEMRLQVIGDISVDINGAIEFTEKVTTPDNPVFVYNPSTDTITDGYKGKGIVVMAVDNLPCELPQESSREFSNALHSFIPDIARADYQKEFNDLDLPPEIKDAVILHHGKLTPNYQYIDKFL